MLQKIPFFELFTALTLPWEDRLALEGACLTAVEVEREKRTLAMALTTTAAIVSAAAATSGVSPILCAIAVCAGGIGLSLPNDSGFWAVSRFFHLNEIDTIRGWTVGGFVAGVSILLFTCVLSLFQGFLPGLI